MKRINYINYTAFFLSVILNGFFNQACAANANESELVNHFLIFRLILHWKRLVLQSKT